jgi:MFS family permease
MVNSAPVLVLGRLLSGVSTSLLFSVFDSWMVCEHRARGFGEGSLGETFSFATLINGVVAVAAGVLASGVCDPWGLGLGFRAPFAVAALVLLSLAAVVWVWWGENVGAARGSSMKTFIETAITDLKSDVRIGLICVIQSLFEGAMYTFVFAWTPALRGACAEDNPESLLPPLGWVFAAFMVGIMVGSQLFSRALMAATTAAVTTTTKLPVARIAQATFGVAAASMLVATISLGLRQDDCSSASLLHTGVVLTAFVVFEVCCGVYFPCFGTLKSETLPERSRSTLMNLARVGLNALLLVVLVSADALPNTAIIFLCSAALGLACFLQTVFCRLEPRTTPSFNDKGKQPIEAI